MAGALMTFTEITFGTIKKIKCVWLSDGATGDVTGTTTEFYSGKLLGAITVPDAVAVPDNLYDVEVFDNDSVDVALGALLNRSNVNTEYVAMTALAAVAESQLTILVENANNAKEGILYLFIR